MFIRDVCTPAGLECQRDKIGRPGLVVEICEAKFDRRKINVWRVIDWKRVKFVICGKMKGTFRATCPYNKINRLAVIDIITQTVNPGSLIIIDCCQVYGRLAQEEWNHLNFNHTNNFVDSVAFSHKEKLENLFY
ncbi:hypothetical protein RF11_07548 [Thelohanellus kitauei]|uniref:ISXO2-like transposase domain-containing protein n=1 Tax=Thelohanellus kitauei TaxID=669202 RepID=A0A0C2INE2_THEKT|nr:hypothetical protein RF11_07548 [Thelohanellus kitauei]